MADNTDITRTYLDGPFLELRDYAWMLATFMLTPITAAVLAMTGYIPMNPHIAAFNGLLVSFMYVGFRVSNAWRRYQLFRKALVKKPDDTLMSE
jgi:hypothetical protein